MLVELGLVEQRYRAVLEVLDDGRRWWTWPAVTGLPGKRCITYSMLVASRPRPA